MSEQPIQWFPGHMAKTIRKLEERMAAVDVIIEIVDARLPQISANPLLERMAARRARITVATRADLADAEATRLWQIRSLGHTRLAVDARRSAELRRVMHVVETCLGAKKSGRVLVVGIPNSGKSTLINCLVGRTVARAENRAGVTRALQWFRISKRLEILDSPGILMPKILTVHAQWMLAITGALPRERYDVEEVIARFAHFCTINRGKHGIPRMSIPTLPEFAQARGFLRRGQELDIMNASLAYVKRFNEGGFGRFSFEAEGLQTVEEGTQTDTGRPSCENTDGPKNGPQAAAYPAEQD